MAMRLIMRLFARGRRAVLSDSSLPSRAAKRLMIT